LEIVRTRPNNRVQALNGLTERPPASPDALLVSDSRILVWEMFRPTEDLSAPLRLVNDIVRHQGMWADNEDVYMTDPAPAGRNAMVTGYCPAITAALRSSHNLEFNGFGHQLRSTLYYLTKYFSKDPHPFVNTLSLALAAVEIEQYPSRAEDRGTTTNCPLFSAEYDQPPLCSTRSLCSDRSVGAAVPIFGLFTLPQPCIV